MCIAVIEDEREVTVDSNTVLYRGSPDLGKVVDPDAVADIEKYDEALNAARATLAAMAKGEE